MVPFEVRSPFATTASTPGGGDVVHRTGVHRLGVRRLVRPHREGRPFVDPVDLAAHGLTEVHVVDRGDARQAAPRAGAGSAPRDRRGPPRCRRPGRRRRWRQRPGTPRPGRRPGSSTRVAAGPAPRRGYGPAQGRTRREGTGRDHQRPENRQRETGSWCSPPPPPPDIRLNMAALMAAASSSVGSGEIPPTGSVTAACSRACGSAAPRAWSAGCRAPRSASRGSRPGRSRRRRTRGRWPPTG